MSRWIAGVLFLAVLAALFTTLYQGAAHRGRLQHCRNNLRYLGQLAHSNESILDPALRGREFWHQVRMLRYRTVKGDWLPMDPDPCACPFTGKEKTDREDPKSIDYLGPAYPSVPLVSERPLAADRPGNHPQGGYMLFYDESVKEVPFRVEGQDLSAEEIQKWLAE